MFALGGIQVGVARQQLDVAGDGLQDVVEVVGHSLPGQYPHGLHLLGLHELLL
jgi:hypothetical protein